MIISMLHKFFLPILTLALLFVGCSYPAREVPQTANLAPYTEWELDTEDIMEFGPQMTHTIQRLKESGIELPVVMEVSPFEKSSVQQEEPSIKKFDPVICTDTKGSCKVVGTWVPDDYSGGYYDFYKIHGEQYSIIGRNTGKKYIYKGQTILFEGDMYDGSDGPVLDVSLIKNKPAFNIMLGSSPENARADIFYENEFFNEKYKVDHSRQVFTYKDKIGFIATKNDKTYIHFNGALISHTYDRIRTTSCCAVSAYPFSLFEEGILLFVAKRGEKFYLVRVDLNKYV